MHVFSLSTQVVESVESKYKASLVCRVSSRTAEATQRNPVFKIKKVGGDGETAQ